MKKTKSILSITPQWFGMKYLLFYSALSGVVIVIGGWKNVVSKNADSHISVIAVKKTNVPFKAHFETVSAVLAPPPILQLRSTGKGIGSHIGRATLVAYPIINLTTAPPFAVSGTLIITAANRDEIFASFIGTRSAPDATGTFIINATYTITGGSGRFQNASGSFDGISTGQQGSTDGSASYDGDISY